MAAVTSQKLCWNCLIRYDVVFIDKIVLKGPVRESNPSSGGGDRERTTGTFVLVAVDS